MNKHRIAAFALLGIVAAATTACAKKQYIERPHEQPDARPSQQVDTTPTDVRENYAVDQVVE